jgi:hypothetical protein
MKQQMNIQTMAESQNQKGVRDASDGSYQTRKQIQNKLKITPSADCWRYGEGFNIFCIQTKSKAPPGQARSPGYNPGGRCMDCIQSALKGFTINNKKELFHNNRYSNFNNILNFKTMKKQILLLVLAFLAAGNAFGQMKTGSAPLPLVGCTNDFLHPLAGVSYNYQALVNPTGGNFQWWATKDVNFITTTGAVTTNNIGSRLAVGTDLIAASASYGATTTTDNVDITWSSGILSNTSAANPTFVVVQNDATGANCANNLKVYPILPINGFTVDIKNMDQAKVPLAYATPYSLCVSNIASARYDGVTKAIVTDYGTNVLYFEVVAANFTGSYTPSFQVSGIAAGQTVTALDLFTDAAFATALIPTTLTAGAYSPAAPLTVDPSVTNTTNGVSIYVRLTIHNGTHETLADDAITLAVNGVNASGEKDVVNTACGTQQDYEDTATQTLTRRPTITAAAGAFVTP